MRDRVGCPGNNVVGMAGERFEGLVFSLFLSPSCLEETLARGANEGIEIPCFKSFEKDGCEFESFLLRVDKKHQEVPIKLVIINFLCKMLEHFVMYYFYERLERNVF